jgi:two-component system, chemotaxis family, chemotaxis protein CheY
MKILLIDDSNLSRNMFKRAMGKEHEYIEAVDGMSGLEMYFLEKPDVVVLDLIMPGMSGSTVLERLLEMDPSAKIIVGTADVQEMSRRMVLEMGAIGFISKPFTPNNTRSEMYRLLGMNDDLQE